MSSLNGLRSVSHPVLVCIAVLALLAPVGCNNGAPGDDRRKDLAAREKAEEEARALADKAAALAAEKAQEEKQAAEAEAAREKAAADALLACCQGLAKAGFEERSMEYMKASDSCEKAHKDGARLGSVMSQIRGELGERELPKSCAGP